MRADEVPQDTSSTYGGHRKLLYAQADSGEYTGVQSTGWEVEAQATRDAIAQFEHWAAQARAQVEAGQKSPLYFHMYDCRMDLPLLSQLTGLWRWRVKRHRPVNCVSSRSEEHTAELQSRPHLVCRLLLDNQKQ